MRKYTILFFIVFLSLFIVRTIYAVDPTATPAPTATPVPCVPPVFTSASVVPSTVRPFDQVTVRCNYGKRLDCLSVIGAGLSNCRYSRYEGVDNIFSCDAGTNVGFYDDAKCVSKGGTTDNCCAATNKAGDMTILGTDVHYDQDVVLPFGSVVLNARVWTVLSKNKGVRIELICNSDTCANDTKKNATIFSLPFPATADYVVKTQLTQLTGSGDDRHYLVRISADKGSEAFIDSVSMKGVAGRELVQNGDFITSTNTTISTTQPAAWGEGDNKIGYYYGSLAANEPAPTGAPNPTAGPTAIPGTPETVSLNLKIKLQGVTKKPIKSDPINVQIKLAGGGLASATAYKTVSFTVDSTGIWSGKTEFTSIPVGAGYRIYVKGPKHLAKKMCDASPTENTGGSYRCSDGKITLQAGENTFDFSKIIQLGGDLPEAGEKQNGIIDAYDSTFIRTNLGTTDAAKIAIGDINLDGGIDTQDYSIILQSLSIKFDEE